MAGDDDRLSALADDLLRHILHFVPFKEAATTSVLSRRWGSLWRSSGAVNLDVRIPRDMRYPHRVTDYKDLFRHRDAFVRAAQAALDGATDARVTRLTLRLEDPGGEDTYNFLHRGSDDSWFSEYDVIRDVVSHTAARHVEELRIAAVDDDVFLRSDEETPDRHNRGYHLSYLPLKALRVLDLTRCSDIKALAIDAFPLMETLRLRLCTVQSSHIQALMDAAPALVTVHLESVFFEGPPAGTSGAPGVRLRCRQVTDLVLDFCGMEGQQSGDGDRGFIEIDAPRLRYFRYRGTERRFSLASPAPDMAVLEMQFLRERYHRECTGYDQDKTRVLFWQFVRNFNSARVLKLKVNYLDDIALGKARRTELLCLFHNVVRLELDGAHHPTTKAAAVAIANLLRCCPAVRDLRLKLSTVPSSSVKDCRYGRPFLKRKDRLEDYDTSVDRLMRRHRLNPVISMDDEDDKQDEVPDGIPGLSGRSLTCLQSSLRRVGLQFRLNNSSCFGTQLVKFFTSNAKVLEEIRIDSGNRKLCEHMNLNVERWIAPNSSNVCLKRKNLAESSWEFSQISRESPNSRTDLIKFPTSFTVLPLKR